ncbi:helix-turn-helix transcriptional regulator [bacterium]|nr:helix-turn-helix transcriptional regulator [bacterium]MBU1064352.1 helix-turn-helix transcriptional regulator [bacterium]MBU1634205.1 helix-turn-helix transcriptional regulator [bacterium]MBU1873304.1 helix-turn-helix transcriptional regulator [bacterium]
MKMNKSDKEYFEELLAQVPDDVVRLVDHQMEISVAIADAIDRSKYKNRKEFAEAIGMKPSMLSRILAGNVNLTLKTITKIESALETEIINVNTQLSVQEKQYNIPPELITSFSSYFTQKEASLFNRIKQYSEDGVLISGSVFCGVKEGVYGNA